MNIMEEYQNYPDPDGAYAAAELRAEWYQEIDELSRRGLA